MNATTYATTLALDTSTTGYGGTRISFDPLTALALGFECAGASYSGADAELITSLGDKITIARSSAGAQSFIGLLYTEGETFSSLTWSSSRFAAGIDNIEGFTAPVPVPATAWLLGSGLIGLAVTRIRRKKK